MRKWSKIFIVLFFLTNVCLPNSLSIQHEDEITSAILLFNENFKDLSAKGEFKSSLYLEGKEKETVIGNFEYKQMGDDYCRLDRSFAKPKPNGSIGDIIIKRQDDISYFQYFPVINSKYQDKVIKAIEPIGTELLLLPFGYILPSEAAYSRVIQKNRQIRFIAPDTTDTLYILEIAYPFEIKCGTELGYNTYASDLTRVVIKKINPLHISYINHSLVPPDGRKITITEVFYGSPLSGNVLGGSNNVEYVVYDSEFEGKKGGVIVYKAELKISEAKINSNLTPEDFVPPGTKP